MRQFPAQLGGASPRHPKTGIKSLSRLLVLSSKLALVLVCVAGAVSAAVHSRLTILSRLHPEAALSADPAFAPAALLMGNLLFAKDQKGSTRRRIHLARTALRDEPLAADAIRQIGLARDAGRISPTTRPYMVLANEMSRRDGLAQIWLAQDRLTMGDVTGAMLHIDTVMRVNRQAQDLIFPILTRFTAAPGFPRALALRSDAGAHWVADYLLFELAKDGSREMIRDVLLSVQRPARLREIANISRETVRELAEAGDGAGAKALYRHAWRSGFLGENEVDSATGWRLFDQAGAIAEWRGSDPDRVLDILAEPDARGIVAQQVRFDGGRGVAEPGLINPRMPAGSQLKLTARCGANSDSAVVWSAAGTADRTRPAVSGISGRLLSGCVALIYSIEVTGPREGGRLAVSIDGLGLPNGEVTR